MVPPPYLAGVICEQVNYNKGESFASVLSRSTRTCDREVLFGLTQVAPELLGVVLVIHHASMGDRVVLAVDQSDELAYKIKEIMNLLTLC